MVEYWYGLPVFLGSSENPNGFATLLAIGLPMGFGLWLTSKRKMQSLFLLISLMDFKTSFLLLFYKIKQFNICEPGIIENSTNKKYRLATESNHV